MTSFEDDVYDILNPYNKIVKSVLTTVGNGAKTEDEGFDISGRIAAVSKNPVVKQVARELTRGLMGMLFGTKRR